MPAIIRRLVIVVAILGAACAYAADSVAPGAPRSRTPITMGGTPEVKSELPSLIPGVEYESFPLMDSSTSASTLSSLIYARAAGLRGELRRVGDMMAGQPDIRITFPLSYTAQQIHPCRYGRLPMARGTHEAYMNLIGNQKMMSVGGLMRAPRESDYVTLPQRDLILEAREPSPDELKAAKEAGVEFDVRPVALDAFVFFVNSANEVKSLTLDQIRDIYTGKTKNWKDLRGNDAEIIPYTRERNSGSQELMDKLVLKGEQGLEVKSLMQYSMMGPIEAVSNTENAIAYSVFYYEHIMSPNLKNRLLGVNGIVPSSETIASRKYPLVAPVYVVTRKGMDPKSPAIRLRDWLLSDDGQRLVAESGYVPIRRVKARP